MAHWIHIKGILYNLDKFTEIAVGEENEILFSQAKTNIEFCDDAEYINLVFDTKEEMQKEFKNILFMLTGEA